ncbi:MAG: outer membrane beta-barrel protein [Gemmatimonadota bacterium]
MRKFGLMAATITLSLAALSPAHGQGAWSVNPYAGVFIADEGGLQDFGDEEGFTVSIDPAMLVGARLGYMSAANWGFEAGYGYSPLSLSVDEDSSFDVDVTAQLFYGALNYTFPSSSAAKFFLSVGAGGINVSGEEADFEEDAETSSTDLLANIGGGVMWWLNDRLSLRADIKDHMDFCKASETEEDFSACPLDDKMLNHIEVSGGVAFQLGGGGGDM